jgi:hypothetical protein
VVTLHATTSTANNNSSLCANFTTYASINVKLVDFLHIQMETRHVIIVVWAMMVFSFSVMFRGLYSNGNLRQMIELHETVPMR